MTSIKKALEAVGALTAAELAKVTTNTVAPKKQWTPARAWRSDPAQRKEHFSALRAERKARWKDVQANGIPALIGWKPRKWEREKRRLSFRRAMSSLLSPATM